MARHVFRNVAAPKKSGAWTDDSGHKICSWDYDGRGELTVWIGSGPVHARRLVVDGDIRSAKDLPLRLAHLALDEASKVHQTKYEPGDPQPPDVGSP